MLTLKLQNPRTGRTAIIEVLSVEIAAGERCHNLSTDQGKEFRVGAGLDYEEAYVENSNGATVHLIRNGEHQVRRAR